MSPALRVVQAGPALTLQDSGRPGYQRFGVAEGGAMDRFALAEGNALLAQNESGAVLEMAVSGGHFQVLGAPLQLATSGCPMDLAVDDHAVPWRCNFTVQPQQIIRIGHARGGIYGYLHVKGGFDVPMVLGSRSTHTRAGFGGFHGRCLRAGDELAITSAVAFTDGMHRLESDHAMSRRELRVVWGAQAHLFSEANRRTFLNARFRMTSRRDRMGARLDTDAESFAATGGLSGISDAVVAGDVQVTGDGVATVLLADRQPTGGYPRIATVISADLGVVAQLPAGTEFTFKQVDMKEAVSALREQQEAIDNLASRLLPLVRDPAQIPDLLRYNFVDGMVSAHDQF
ncbi:hypothetical protein AB833_23605 [Chromatiales bacterium (ex Bugula neritina AB1)]|nr:hypothetical protein AB833_23605 [Chromatiales bacterium (ex Bugula neritina AB1)]